MARYENIMTKVSPETAARLDRVKEAGAFKSRYEVVQAAVKLMLKYADPGGEVLEPDMLAQVEDLKRLFGDISEVRHCIARVKPNGGRKVEPSEVVAFYGKECLMLQVLGADGSSSTTVNQRDVLEVVLAKTLPSDTLRRLRELRRAGGYPTLLATLMYVIGAARVEDNEVGQLSDEYSDADPRIVRLGIENKPARAKARRNFDK